jgi:hypothetical protein
VKLAFFAAQPLHDGEAQGVAVRVDLVLVAAQDRYRDRLVGAADALDPAGARRHEIEEGHRRSTLVT